MQCLEIFEGKCPKIPPWLHACLQVFKKDLWLVRFNPWSLSSASLVSATNSVCSAPRFGAYACIIHGGQPNNLKFNMPTLSPGVIHSLTKLSIWVKSCNPLDCEIFASSTPEQKCYHKSFSSSNWKSGRFVQEIPTKSREYRLAFLTSLCSVSVSATPGVTAGMGVGRWDRGALASLDFEIFSNKMVIFLVLSGKKQTSPLLVSLGKNPSDAHEHGKVLLWTYLC